MKKMISLFAIAGALLVGTFAPQSAEATKVRIQPSISFNHSHSTHYSHGPRPYYYAPRPAVVHHYHYPYETVTYVENYYPAPYYRRPVHTHSHGVNYGLTLNFR